MSHPPSLEDIYRTHSQRLYSFLLRFLGNESDTKDVIQQVFLRIARGGGLPDGVRDPVAYLLRLTYHEAVDLCRRRGARDRRHEKWGDDQPTHCEDISSSDGKEMNHEVSEALAALPEDQRAVIELKLWQEMTFAQIAQVLDISTNTAASRYRYALDKLQTRLRPVYEEYQ